MLSIREFGNKISDNLLYSRAEDGTGQDVNCFSAQAVLYLEINGREHVLALMRTIRLHDGWAAKAGCVIQAQDCCLNACACTTFSNRGKLITFQLDRAAVAGLDDNRAIIAVIDEVEA